MTIDMTFERREEIFRKEEREEGKAEGILEILEDYGPVPDELVTRIMGEKDISTLSNWIKTAVRCSSVDEFTDLIG